MRKTNAKPKKASTKKPKAVGTKSNSKSTRKRSTTKPKTPTKRKVKAINYNKIPFVKAKAGSFIDLTDKESRGVRVIVIHCMEAPEKPDTAENVSKWLSTQGVSVHYCVDNDSIVQMVQCRDVAYGCKGMNRHGIQIELPGYARQTRAEWNDDYSKAALDNAAKLIAWVLVPKFGIQTDWLSPDQIRKVTSEPGITGFVTHDMVTKALNIPGGHTDPGKSFPLNDFMNKIRYYVNNRP